MGKSKKQKEIKVKLVKGYLHRKPSHRATVRALGLRKINDENILPVNESVLGMINTVNYLVETEEIE